MPRPDGRVPERRQLAEGFIEAKDLDEAIAIASGFVGTSTIATIEVRPIVDIEGVSPVPAEKGRGNLQTAPTTPAGTLIR